MRKEYKKWERHKEKLLKCFSDYLGCKSEEEDTTTINSRTEVINKNKEITNKVREATTKFCKYRAEREAMKKKKQ